MAAGDVIGYFGLTEPDAGSDPASMRTTGRRTRDEGRAARGHIGYGTLSNVRMANDVARRARAVLGANGITLECPVMRDVVNLESSLTYEGTHQIHTLVPGRALTEQAAFGNGTQAQACQ
jgi:alkylation response protein AidB-like acyl-CoA dehydrogenase